MEGSASRSVPTPFIWRRVHSLLGLWLVIYLCEHLLVNSQAALWIGDDGHGFIRLVNLLESLPYLQVIEIVLIGIPLVVHGIWGVKRALQAKENSKKSDGSTPSLDRYSRNRAFTWQRITSWILLIGIIAHVVQMRFLDFPKKTTLNNEEKSIVKLTFDDGLASLGSRLGVSFYTKSQIDQVVQTGSNEEYFKKLSSFRLQNNQVVAVASSPGTAMLLNVRDTFKSPLMAILYTIFVLSAAFHAFNGFWTFLITWGVILSMPSQKSMTKVAVAGILLLSFFGLVTIWGSYWINLRT